jgi:hypothetical protein
MDRKFTYKISRVFLPGSSSLFSHNATALLPHRSSIRAKMLRDLLHVNFRSMALA